MKKYEYNEPGDCISPGKVLVVVQPFQVVVVVAVVETGLVVVLLVAQIALVVVEPRSLIQADFRPQSRVPPTTIVTIRHIPTVPTGRSGTVLGATRLASGARTLIRGEIGVKSPIGGDIVHSGIFTMSCGSIEGG